MLYLIFMEVDDGDSDMSDLSCCWHCSHDHHQHADLSACLPLSSPQQAPAFCPRPPPTRHADKNPLGKPPLPCLAPPLPPPERASCACLVHVQVKQWTNGEAHS